MRVRKGQLTMELMIVIASVLLMISILAPPLFAFKINSSNESLSDIAYCNDAYLSWPQIRLQWNPTSEYLEKCLTPKFTRRPTTRVEGLETWFR
ncbi:MAG: hypothetical protein J4432_02990 [DPANN group archaeon]|nr:hypothetical protein [DPANN group archaeon]